MRTRSRFTLKMHRKIAWRFLSLIGLTTTLLLTGTAAQASAAVKQTTTPGAPTLTTGNTHPAKAFTKAASAPAADTVIEIPDANLAAAVRQGLGLSDQPITVGDLQQFDQAILPVTTTQTTPVKSLAGLAALQYLPSKTLIDLDLYVPPYPDFVPIDYTALVDLRFRELQVIDSYLGRRDLTPFLSIDPTTIAWMGLSGGGDQRKKNQNGMTNAQLAELAPWINAVGFGALRNNYKQILLNMNNLTDFSPLAPLLAFDQPNAYLTVMAVGQAVYDDTPLNVVTGQPLTLTPLPATGLKNETLVFKNWYSHEGTPTGETTAKVPTNPDGSFTYDAVYPPVSGANHFSYGQLGMSGPNDEYNFDYTPAITLQYEYRVYRTAVDWQAHPVVNVAYQDTAGKTLQPTEQMGVDTKIGDPFDFTAKTKLAGYTFLPEKSSAVTGTYDRDPQTLTLVFDQETAAPITVTYVDQTTGKRLHQETLTGAPGTTSSYQTTATIDDYLAQGYELVSDAYPAAGAVFGSSAQDYQVKFRHQTTAVNDLKTVTQTIHYVYANGKPAAVDQKATVTFSRTGSQDLVTDATDWAAWTADQGTTFAAKKSPTIPGYQPDQTVIATVTGITAASPNLTSTVTYHAKTTTGETADTGKPDTGTPEVSGPTTGGAADLANAGTGNALTKANPVPTATVTPQTDNAFAHQAAATNTRLPQTDDQPTALLLAGLALLVSALVGWWHWQD